MTASDKSHKSDKNDKKLLRREVLARARAMDPADAAARSREACRLLIALPEFARADRVMVYRALRGEVDPQPVAEAAWAAGKTVCLPRADWPTRSLEIVVWRSLDDPMRIGRYNIEEPVSPHVLPPERLDLIVLPAAAYDRGGRRLGKGGGFYDRLLAREGLRAVCCGIAFSQQLLRRVPTEAHDRPVQILVTEQDVLRPPADDA